MGGKSLNHREIIQALTAQKYTQVAIARACGVSINTVNRWAKDEKIRVRSQNLRQLRALYTNATSKT